MLSSDTAREVGASARGYAEEAAQRFLANSVLLREQVAPPREPRERGAWEARQDALRAELYLAALELDLFLRLAKLAGKGRG